LHDGGEGGPRLGPDPDPEGGGGIGPGPDPEEEWVEEVFEGLDVLFPPEDSDATQIYIFSISIH
jgi:hypothetical protein